MFPFNYILFAKDILPCRHSSYKKYSRSIFFLNFIIYLHMVQMFFLPFMCNPTRDCCANLPSDNSTLTMEKQSLFPLEENHAIASIAI